MKDIKNTPMNLKGEIVIDISKDFQQYKTGKNMDDKKITTSTSSVTNSFKLHTGVKSRKERIPRNRGGCLCCRKRKIKCDERKPTCLKCERRSLVCCWPENGSESLSHNNSFRLVKLDTSLRFIDMNPAKKNSCNIEVETQIKQKNCTFIKIEPSNLLVTTRKNSDTGKKTNNNNTNNVDEDALIRQYIRESTKPFTSIGLSELSLLNLDCEEIKLYDAFVNGFIVSISNQLTHQKLLPGTIIIPPGLVDPLITKMCLTCGASFLYSSNIDNSRQLIDKVKDINKSIVKGLIHRLDTHSIMESRELILMYITLQNVRQKFMYEGRNSQTINIISGVEAIKLWIETKKRQSWDDKESKISELNDSVLNSLNDDSDGDVYKVDDENDEADSYIFLDKLVNKTNKIKAMYPIKYNENSTHNDNINDHHNDDDDANTAIGAKKFRLLDVIDIKSDILLSCFTPLTDSKYPDKVSAFERFLLENFIFNYSGTLLIIDKSLIPCVPSPFEVFDMIARLLSVPIYNCAVPWMNNPTVGAALPMIELQAKIIWCSLKEDLDESDLKLVKAIQKTAKYYTRPIIPEEVWRTYPKKVTKKLLESCLISEIIAKGVHLFSLKILNKSLDETDLEVQEIVDSMLKILDSVSLHSQTSVVAKCAFVIIGAAIVDKNKQEILKNRLIGFVDALKTGSLKSALQFLTTIWEKGIGLDALFIEEYLDLLAI